MPPESQRRSVVSFVRRGGRITVGQQRAWDTHWQRLGRDVDELPAGPIEPDVWFGRSAPVLLEIGSGMGEATSLMVAAEPSVNYLAVEVYEPGLAQLMLRAAALDVTNLRLLRGDAVDLLSEHVAPRSLAGVRIFFPDPWPKTKHHKRRLVRPDFVALVADRLAIGGRLHLATDWAEYADVMLAVCGAEPLLRNEFPGWAPRPDWRPMTKFETRARAEGRECRDLMFVRVTA
jgi:tRNA (guanine-N7-)-methyltransferase